MGFPCSEQPVRPRIQEQASTLTLENHESMEICVDNKPTTNLKATSADFHSRTPNSTIHSTSQIPTPPLTVSAPTPIPLDPATKTAQIIAQIKEKAYAKTRCDHNPGQYQEWTSQMRAPDCEANHRNVLVVHRTKCECKQKMQVWTENMRNNLSVLSSFWSVLRMSVSVLRMSVGVLR
jgi:hypothetical protein